MNLNELQTWIKAFLRDCRTRELSPHTVEFYRLQLAAFQTFCNSRNVTDVTQITPDLVRDFLDMLIITGHNPGGRHAKYRALRAFLIWWAEETEPDNWKNPLKKVKPPKIAAPPIPGVPLADVVAMIATCQIDFHGRRDKAILLCLLDTGARVAEFVALDLSDVDLTGGGVSIHKGKGNKPRTVFIGKKARRSLRVYLKEREDKSPALWVTVTGERLAIHSLQSILKRRSVLAGVPAASPHDFRRAFALALLRSGCDIFTLQKLMGHSDLTVLKRYLDLVDEDIKAAHDKGSPADKL